MLFSYTWLSSYFNEDLPAPEKLAERVNLRAFEFEGLEWGDQQYPQVVVGLIEEVEKHPRADRLSVCRVAVGKAEPLTIVCGASNVVAGLLVPVALVGAELPNGVKIEKATIRGVESAGMICSARELGEEGAIDDHTIKVLEGQAGQLQPGQWYDHYLDRQPDPVLDFDILPDRACYALCHRGMAGEIAAILDRPLQPEPRKKINTDKTRSLSIEVKEDRLCARYMGRVLEGVAVKPTTGLMVDRLKVLGQKPINNVVDSLNYLMLEMGQPMHAFDADKVKGSIIVRRAESGEVMTTLDGRDLDLTADMLVIADQQGPLALAGIKGGQRAEVTAETQNIILEAANFDPVSVRKTSAALSLRTDASKRFENHLSPTITDEALDKAVGLIQEQSPAAIAGPVVDIYPIKQPPTVIDLEPAFVNSVLGLEVSESAMERILYNLGITVEKGPAGFVLTIPTVRRDLQTPIDIVEEIGRIYGYDQITGALPAVEAPASVNKEFYYCELIKDVLVARGFSEVSLYSLTTAGDIQIESSAAAADKDHLRNDLKTGLKKCLLLNARQAPVLGLEEIRVFEIGRVFKGGREVTSVAIGILATDRNRRAGQKHEEVELKDLTVDLNQTLKTDLSTAIEVDEFGSVMEWELDTLIQELVVPDSYQALDYSRVGKAVSFRSLSAYPFNTRDLAVWVPPLVDSKEVERIILQYAGDLLINHYLFDVYQKADRVSYAFRLVFQAPDRTLSDKEVNLVMDKIYQDLNNRVGWEVR